MEEKRDKLGRRIPQFDRSAAGKKSAKTQKEKYGPDFHSRIGADGGRKRTRGYFGKLKAENPEALTKITKEAGKTGTKHFARLKDENPEELSSIAKKGRHAERKQSKRNGNSVS